MTEKELLKKSGFYTSFILFFVSLFWFLFSIQTSFGGYTGGPVSGIDVGINSRSTTQTNWQVGSSGVYVIRLGIENVTGLGTATGYMTGTNTYYPRIEWTPTLGTFNFVGTGSYPVALQINGVAIPSLGSVSGKIDAVAGTGSANVFTNTTLAGQGTITASFGANGLVISPAEYASVNNATSELQSQIDGKQSTLVNNSPGTITNVLGYTPPANTPGSITTALGYTPPANTSGSITTALGYTPPANTAGSITTALGYTPTNLGNSIALGTETTGNSDNISEGLTNKYYTDGRVNAAVGSLSVNTLSDVNIIFNENDFVKIVGGQLVAGSSTATVAFSEVTGSATTNNNFKFDPVINTVPVRDSTGNLFVNGIIGGTTTGALRIPSGTVAQRPGTPTIGMLRWNTNTAGTGTGGTISTSGTYTIHTFTSSGTFAAPTLIGLELYDGTAWQRIQAGTATVEVLLVGGGGGSNGYSSGGGSGAEVIQNNSFAVAGNTTVTIGAGGVGADGNNSVFGSLTALPGQAGANDSTNGENGVNGSGGGGTVSIGGTGTSGYNGGAGIANLSLAGGGAGAGASGGSASGSTSGVGGTGTASSISGTLTYYAGGGSGGGKAGGTAGGVGLGGGGLGVCASPATKTTGGAGTANTGGGGGGNSYYTASDNTNSSGGSGVIIVRYISSL